MDFLNQIEFLDITTIFVSREDNNEVRKIVKYTLQYRGLLPRIHIRKKTSEENDDFGPKYY